MAWVRLTRVVAEFPVTTLLAATELYDRYLKHIDDSKASLEIAFKQYYDLLTCARMPFEQFSLWSFKNNMISYRLC